MSTKGGQKRLGVSALTVGALGWALSAALGWSLFDASSLALDDGVGYLEAWTAAGFAGFKVALGALPFGLVAGWIWHRSRLGRRLRAAFAERPARSGAALVCAVLAWVATSYATFGALTLYRSLFASELVHKLALSISVPGFALVSLLLAYRAHAPLGTLLGRIGSRGLTITAAAAASLVLMVGWAVGLILLGLSVWKNLMPHIYLPLAIIGVCSVLGAVLANFRRARYVATAAGLLILPIAGFAAFGEPSKQLRLALSFRDTGTGFITKLTSPSGAQSFAAAASNRGRSAVCGPGIEPPELSDVGRAGAQAPDVIWLTLDAFRWDHTSLGGYERDTTPRIAEHARGGAVFERAYAPATSTRQSMRSLFTGVYPSMIESPRGPTYALTIADEQHTVAEFMQSAGYETIALSSDAYIFSVDHGALQGFGLVDESYYDIKQEIDYTAPHIIDRIIDELDAGGEPKFVWTHLLEPHEPFVTGPGGIEFGPEELDQYHAAMHYADMHIGRLLDYVAQRQSERPTYVILSSDHGEAFGEHGQIRHGKTVFQEEAHVPLLVWGPDVVAGRYVQPVSVLDIYPTTFDLAGLEVPRGSCGSNLAQTLRTGEEPEARPVFSEQVPDGSRTFFSAGFVNGRYRLMVQPMSDAVTLFDLAEDPGEFDDIADREPQLLEEHLGELRRFMRERGMEPADYSLQ